MARLLRDNHVVEQAPLRFAGRTSTYIGELPVKTAGEFTLEVLAMEPTHANFGLARQDVTVTR